MPGLMRCLYCGCLQDEPVGVKTCARCGGELVAETGQPPTSHNYLQAQMELDQITAPADKSVERHLIVTIRTPAQAPANESAPTDTGRKPLSFTMALDASGSMQGVKFDWARKAIQQAVRSLHDGDVAALVTFDSVVHTRIAPAPVDAGLRQGIESLLGDLHASGQTALCGGLEAGIAAARQGRQDVNLVLLLSDGQANVGETDLEKVGARALDASNQGIIVSALGVGNDYNEALLSEIATQGGGRFYHLQYAQQIAPYVAGELGEASSLVARNVVLHLNLPLSTGLGVFSSAYRLKENAQVQLGDIPADTTLEVAIRLRLPPQAAGSRLRIEGHLTYTSPADHSLEAPLNPVTLRYVENQQFAFRDGVVPPVAHRVLEQMQATGVLNTTRVAGRGLHDQVSQANRESVESVRQYASLLGEKEAAALADAYQQELDRMQSDRAYNQTSVAQAHRIHRAAKKHS